MRLSLTEKIWNHSDNVSVLNENDWIKYVNEDLRFFEKEILTAMKTNGWDGDEDISKSQWTFVGSLFYSIIVITTIGKWAKQFVVTNLYNNLQNFFLN